MRQAAIDQNLEQITHNQAGSTLTAKSLRVQDKDMIEGYKLRNDHAEKAGRSKPNQMDF
jgi:hypothetical protein